MKERDNWFCKRQMGRRFGGRKKKKGRKGKEGGRRVILGMKNKRTFLPIYVSEISFGINDISNSSL